MDAPPPQVLQCGCHVFTNDIPSYRIYNPDDLYCEVADVTTDGIAGGGANAGCRWTSRTS